MIENRTCETLSNGGDDSSVWSTKMRKKLGKFGSNLIMNIIVLPDMENQDRVEEQILANEKSLEGN